MPQFALGSDEQMKATLATPGPPGRIQEVLSQIGFAVTPVGIDGLVAHAGDASAFTDIIIIDPPHWTESGELGIAYAMRFVEAVRRLPGTAAMWDGRKWSGVPIAIVQYGVGPDAVLRDALERTGIILIDETGSEATKRALHGTLRHYRERLMDEYTELGFHVIEDNGVFYVNGIAVQMRAGRESDLYNGDKDMRIGRMFVIHRDGLNLGREIDELQELINRPGPEEPLQAFLEKHPHFITDDRGRAIPHPNLPIEAGREKDVPDFAVTPFLTVPRDTDFEIIEIKRADARLIAQQRARVRKFSAAVRFGIDQLREVKRNMQNPANDQAVARALGRPVRHPRLGLIIGRTPSDEDVTIMDEQQAYDMDVSITTWDQIVERKARQLPPDFR